MRFSTRFLFAVIAYSALVIGAIAVRSDRLADVVWVVSLLAMCFAVVVAGVASELRRAMALGFVTLALAHLVGLYIIPDRLPVRQVLSAAGYGFGREGDVFERIPGAAPPQARTVPGMASVARTINALSTLAVGAVGCFIGWLAYKYCARCADNDSLH